jgi:hypothetical protein
MSLKCMLLATGQWDTALLLLDWSKDFPYLPEPWAVTQAAAAKAYKEEALTGMQIYDDAGMITSYNAIGHCDCCGY